MRAVRALQNATGTAENADGCWNEAKKDLVAIKTANPVASILFGIGGDQTSC